MEIPSHIKLECSNFKCRNSRDALYQYVLLQNYVPGEHYCTICESKMQSDDDIEIDRMLLYLQHSPEGYERKYITPDVIIDFTLLPQLISAGVMDAHEKCIQKVMKEVLKKEPTSDDRFWFKTAIKPFQPGAEYLSYKGITLGVLQSDISGVSFTPTPHLM